MYTRVRIIGRLPLIFMIWTFMVCGASWQHYGEWVDVTNDVSKINEAKRAAIEEGRPVLVLYSRPGSDCTHCKTLWEGALCDGGTKCAGDSCPLSISKHPWSVYSKTKKVILLYVNISLNQDLLTHLNNQHRLHYTGAYPVYALFHVKDTADCETLAKNEVLNQDNVDCLGASFYGVALEINGVRLEDSFDSFKALFESYFAAGMETYGMTLDPDAEDTREQRFTAYFEASDYMVYSDAESVEIPVVIHKGDQFTGEIDVTVMLDNSSFGNKAVFFKDNATSTTLTWSAEENPAEGDPEPKNVVVYLQHAGDEVFWKDGATKRTVTLSFAQGRRAVFSIESETTTIHIMKASASSENPYAVVEGRFSGTLMNGTEAVGAIDLAIEKQDDALELKPRVSTLVMVDGMMMEETVEFPSCHWDGIDDDGIATATTGTSVYHEGRDVELRLDLALRIDKNGRSVAGSHLVVKQLNDETEIASYEIDMARNATREELQNLGAAYTVVLDPCESEGLKEEGYGGMVFRVDKENNLVTYHGFMPDGASCFEGTAPLRVDEEMEAGTQIVKEYGEFTIFTKLWKNGEAMPDDGAAWFASVVKIDLQANGHGFICVQCSQKISEDIDVWESDETILKCVWYQNTGKSYFSLIGSKFDRKMSLTEQLGKNGSFVNQYYLVAEKPESTDIFVDSLLMPSGSILREDTGAFVGDSSLFGVDLSFDVVVGDGDGLLGLEGTFGGRMNLYSRDLADGVHTLPVVVKGVLLGTDSDCCSMARYPVGYGYAIWEGEDGESHRLGLRIIWGGSLLLDGEIDETLDDSIRPPSPALDVRRYGDVDVSGIDLEEVLLSSNEDRLIFNGEVETVAVDAEGTAVWLGKSSELGLPSGIWSVYHIDMAGGNRESEPLTLTLTDSVVCRMVIHPGWNLVAIPWEMQELAWNQEKWFHEQYSGNIYTVVNDSYVLIDSPLKAGEAYWIFAQKKNAVTMYGIVDDFGREDRIDHGLPEKNTWYFGADPGVERRSAGMVWNGRKIVPAEGGTDEAGGWWYIKED